ncbi:g2869 [Coccomyxa elongata]
MAEVEFQAGELDGVEGGSGVGSHDEHADANAELEAMKARLAQMEAEANKLREQQAKGEDPALGRSDGADAALREDADNRSVYVGQVDYACTPEELQMHFQSCGTVNRVTILTDKFGNPKGYAYIEFLEADAVANALLLDSSELHGRQLKVLPKRTNVPGLKVRGRGRGAFRGSFRGGFRGRGGYYGGGGGYGYAPRGRRGRFYSPY